MASSFNENAMNMRRRLSSGFITSWTFAKDGASNFDANEIEGRDLSRGSRARTTSQHRKRA
jgi:hypothetical protein